MCPNIARNNNTKVLTVVKNIPKSVGKSKVEVAETTETKTISSGKNPEVPGKPTLAKDINSKKNEKTGIDDSNPENAIIDRVWYRSDRTPTK